MNKKIKNCRVKFNYNLDLMIKIANENAQILSD